MKKLFRSAVIAVIAAGSLALVIPTPVVNACVKCVLRQCPPCTRLGGYVSCWKCPTCQPIEGCNN